MRRPLRPEEVQIWSQVLETVKPGRGRARPAPPPAPPPPAATVAPKPATAPPAAAPLHRPRPAASIGGIEPNRARRIALGREMIARRLDLHGYSQDQARGALERFITGAYLEGARAVLVITGKGLGGDGILRRMTPEWLASAPLRSMIAGLGEARHRHGGKGAIYVALKRRPD